jgi:hypothetical protein
VLEIDTNCLQSDLTCLKPLQGLLLLVLKGTLPALAAVALAFLAAAAEAWHQASSAACQTWPC